MLNHLIFYCHLLTLLSFVLTAKYFHLEWDDPDLDLYVESFLLSLSIFSDNFEAVSKELKC